MLVIDFGNSRFKWALFQGENIQQHNAFAYDAVSFQQDLNLVQQTMWNYAGIVRSDARLSRAKRILLELREEIQDFYHDCKVTPELIELRNAVQTALLVVHAAALNPVSKGCHFMASSDD